MARLPNLLKPSAPKPDELKRKIQDNVVWKSIFRPGSIYRKGYRDTSRDRALAAMNNVLYHLHPVKVKRHGTRSSVAAVLLQRLRGELHDRAANRQPARSVRR